MKKYLIFDSFCPKCSELAHTILDASNDQLLALPIHETKAKSLLNSAFPAGWTRVPYLVIVNKNKVSAYTGIGAAIRLVKLLGLGKSLSVWKLAMQKGVTVPPGTMTDFNTKRRRLLKGLISTGLFATLAKLFSHPKWVKADHWWSATGCSGCFTNCWDLGNYTECVCSAT